MSSLTHTHFRHHFHFGELLYFWLCGLCVGVHLQRPEEGDRCPGAGLSNGCEPPNVGDGNELGSSKTAICALNHGAISPVPPLDTEKKLCAGVVWSEWLACRETGSCCNGGMLLARNLTGQWWYWAQCVCKESKLPTVWYSQCHWQSSESSHSNPPQSIHVSFSFVVVWFYFI